MQIVGDLKSAGNIRIEGRVNGEIHAQAVDFSPGALIDGTISALAIQIGGTVKGRVEAKQVKIQNSGEMLGDVLYEALEMESGATLEGSCKRQGSKPSIQQDVGVSAKRA
jgi:cytoskeletal protein CcmA (bactofilin family)